MPRLAPAKGSTWKRVLEELAARWPRYVRRKEEPDKEALLADAAKLPLSLMRLTVVQDEKFFIEPKQEEPAQ
jgi:phage host-nuclease inhibitor protein Gam